MTSIGHDMLDPILTRGGFDLHRREPYPLAEVDERLQRRFGDDVTLKAAAKERLGALGLLRENLRPSTVPVEVQQLKQAIRRDQAQEARPSRPPSLQARLQALQQQLAQLIADQGGEEDENEHDDWEDPRRQDYTLSASSPQGSTRVRTNSRGILVDRAGKPITLRGCAW